MRKAYLFLFAVLFVFALASPLSAQETTPAAPAGGDLGARQQRADESAGEQEAPEYKLSPRFCYCTRNPVSGSEAAAE